MRGWQGWTAIAATSLIGLIAATTSQAQTVEFESPVYTAGTGFVGVDQWAGAADPTGDPADGFLIQSGPEGQFAHIRTDGLTTVHRPFNVQGGMLDVRWKWRALGDSAHLCLGVSGAGITARGGNRGLACLEPFGVLSAQGGDLTAKASGESLNTGIWYYMRMVLDNGIGANRFTLYIAQDSLRADERVAIPAMAMGGAGNFTRLVLRGEDGSGYADVDDISWCATSLWQGGQDPDSSWSSVKNWSGNTVPDSLTHAVFPAGAGGCTLDRNATVASIVVQSGFKGHLDLGQRILTVRTGADFSGGEYPGGAVGRIRFASPRGHSLIGPESGRTLAPIRHEGGTLRLDRQPLFTAGLEQVGGAFDFHGFDLVVIGDFTIRNGRPGTLRNLDGRSISVGRAARLEGVSKDTLLGLSAGPKGWSIAGSAADSLLARFATIANAHATLATGYATQSVDAGGNSGWLFLGPPVLVAQPRDTSAKVGESAGFRVSVSSRSAVAYQWLRDGTEIPGAVDSVYALQGLAKADSGAAFTCRLTNASGTIYTDPAILRVGFPAPTVSPAPQPVGDSLSVTLTPSVPDAVLRYSRNGGPWTAYAGAIVLRDSTALRAFCVLGADTSGLGSWIYPKTAPTQLTPPSASPAGGNFIDSIVVRLSPPAEAPQAAIYYLIGSLGPYIYHDSLVLRGTATLKAIAISGSRQSDTARWDFRKRLEAPSILPKVQVFPDTLRIFLSTKVSGAGLHYTVDGKDPTPDSPVFPAQGLLIDSSTMLKAIAVKGADASAVVSETYTLIPDVPSISPRGGDYSSAITIQLESSASRAVLYYTLDGSIPGPERGLPPYSAPFRLDTSATLQAVAVAGNGANVKRSPLLSEKYTFIMPGARVLGPGGRIDLSSNYSLVSPLAGAAPVDVVVLPIDSLKNLKGFRDILFGIRLSVPQGYTAFPEIVFNAPDGETRALYSLGFSGQVRFIADPDTSVIPAPGTYFMARDTSAPVITFSGENFTPEDSTRLVVSIQDNVSNLLLDLDRSDKPEADFQSREISSGMLLSVSLKNPDGSLLPLTLRLAVGDHALKAAFPPDGKAYALAQRSTFPVRTPPAFHIGGSPDNPWDLIALPLAAEPPLTMAALRKNNSLPEMEGVAINPATGKYRYLKDDEALAPGAGIWIAARSSLPSMVFPAIQTAGHRGSAGYDLTLHHGWNLVANPTMNVRYWPVTRNDPDTYDVSLLKGLFSYDAETLQYAPAESLDPWRGYFAYYHGDRDTVATLLPDPLPAPAQAGFAAAKRASGDGPFSFRLELAGGLVLRLGAGAAAGDGIGVEDEPQPLTPVDNGPRLFSERGRARLATDLVRWSRNGLYSWKVVAGLPGHGPSGRDLSSHGLSARADSARSEARILAGALPEGYAAWAVSRRRGLRFRLDAGGGIPMLPGFTDSLEVLAGPIAELESRLASIPESVPAFSARASAVSGNIALDLRMPRAARLRVSLWSLDGRVLESEALDLPQGRYHLVRSRGGSGYPAGLYALILESSGGVSGGASGGNIPRRLAIKIAIP